MELEYAFFADYATIAHDKKLVVVGGDIDSVTVNELPSLARIFLVSRLIIHAGENAESHSVGLSVTSPTGEQLPIADAIPVKAKANESGRPGAGRAILDLHIVFTKPGMHTFRLMIDGKEAKSFPFRVNLVTSEAAEDKTHGSFKTARSPADIFVIEQVGQVADWLKARDLSPAGSVAATFRVVQEMSDDDRRAAAAASLTDAQLALIETDVEPMQ
jgi:hypothetical protein